MPLASLLWVSAFGLKGSAADSTELMAAMGNKMEILILGRASDLEVTAGELVQA